MSESKQTLTLQDFDFEVPPALIAQQPASTRASSRLLVASRQGPIRHCQFTDIVEELPPRSVLILNRSRVIPSRLLGQLPTGGKVEIFLLEPDSASDSWRALGRPGRKLKPGTRVAFNGGVEAEIITQEPLVVRFHGSDSLFSWLDQFGYVPLPPYISRDDPRPAAESPDKNRYQTVYAREQGSVAAPTAGLHFDEDILAKIRNRGIGIAEVCLHVGGGTFLPVKANDPADHQMHAETFMIPEATLEFVDQAMKEGRPIIPVGTTAFRALESYYTKQVEGGDPKPGMWLRTSLFVRPDTRSSRHSPAVSNGIVTNFHQPKSTLFMLIAALMGYERAHEIYRIAIEERYRLFSYGDSSLLQWQD